jgi:negative regulator of flagellin synthesis FlgM
MQIYGPAQLHGAQGISAPHINTRTSSVESPSRGIDTSDILDISSEGMFAEKMSDIPEMRMDRVNSLRAQIANGTYDTDAKLDMALERMLDEIG